MSRISKLKKQRRLLDQQRICTEIKRARNRYLNPAPEKAVEVEALFRRAA